MGVDRTNKTRGDGQQSGNEFIGAANTFNKTPGHDAVRAETEEDVTAIDEAMLREVVANKRP